MSFFSFAAPDRAERSPHAHARRYDRRAGERADADADANNRLRQTAEKEPRRNDCTTRSTFTLYTRIREVHRFLAIFTIRGRRAMSLTPRMHGDASATPRSSSQATRHEPRRSGAARADAMSFVLIAPERQFAAGGAPSRYHSRRSHIRMRSMPVRRKYRFTRRKILFIFRPQQKIKVTHSTRGRAHFRFEVLNIIRPARGAPRRCRAAHAGATRRARS